MSHINDNNLDDLLRRAAEKYPLRTDSADFNKLVADLEEDPSLILPPMAEDRRRRRFFWLFFLLPLAGGAYYAWHGTSGRGHQSGVAQEHQAAVIDHTTGTNPAKDNISKYNNLKDNTSTDNTTKGSTTKDNTDKDNTTKGHITQGNVTKNNTAEDNKTKDNTAKSDIVKSDIPKDNTIKRDIAKDNGSKVNSTKIVIAKENSSKENSAKENTTKELKIKGNKSKDNVAKNNTTARDNSTLPAKANGGDGNEVAATGVSPRTTDRKISLANTKDAASVNIPVKSNTEEPVKKSPAAKDKIKLQKPKPSFYVGIIGSPDLSLVRFQSIKAVGNNFGLLLGYSFNSRWAVETGIYYDRKKYYTDGEYFSKSKAPRLNDIDLKTVDGICYMWEIPLNVRYNFPSVNNKMKWFATGGLSTYLMSKENYTFTGDYWGNPNWKGTYTYKTPYHYLFSILNLSVGYEQRLGKIGDLRLEPFLRVPLAGIGTGDLSIMSAGLNICITRRIW